MAGSAASLVSFASLFVRRARSPFIPGKSRIENRWRKVEKFPQEFEIDMIRCIYCGLCEEVCPEQAIFLRKDYAITGLTRQEMVHNKQKLYELGGVMTGLVDKWNDKK